MTSPFETEKRFHQLLHRLQFPAPPRVRLQQICTFLKSIPPETIEPYVLELGMFLPRSLEESELAGVDPEKMAGFYDCLSRCTAAVPRASEIPGFSETIARCRTLTGILYRYIGDEANARRFGVEQVESEEFRPDPSSAVIPVVEREIGESGESMGALRKVRLGSVEASESGRDDVSLDVATFGASQEPGDLLADPIGAYRAYVNEVYPQLTRSFIRAGIRFEKEHSLHEGSSANLALAVLMFCALLRTSLQRDSYAIAPDAAITGAIESDGDVLPVDPLSIRSKCEAVFFSPFKVLVVPGSQISEFEAELETLRKKYPGKELTLLGVSHLRELFFDRRIIANERISAVRHGFRRAWKWRRPIAASVILLLSLTLARVLYGPVDKVPVGYELEGETLTITNRSGQSLTSISVGQETAESVNPAMVLFTYKMADFADIDGDGRSEVVWFQLPTESKRHRAIVHCRTIGEEEDFWPPFDLSVNPIFPHNSDFSSSSMGFRANQLYVDDLDADGRLEILVNYTHDTFPGIIQKLDAATGAPLDHYLHIGHLNTMKLADLDGDGIKEILLAGANNAFREACFVVLDPRNMSGHSPLTREYEVSGYARAQEWAYVRFPTSVVGSNFRRFMKQNVAFDIIANEASGTIQVKVLDVNVGLQGVPYPLTGNIWVTLNYDLSCAGQFTGDDYDTRYDELVSEGIIPNIPRKEALDEYGKSLRYLQDEQWVSWTELRK